MGMGAEMTFYTPCLLMYMKVFQDRCFHGVNIMQLVGFHRNSFEAVDGEQRGPQWLHFTPLNLINMFAS